MEYCKLPVPAIDQGMTDKTYGANEVGDLINTLRAIPIGWNTTNALNPKKLVFLEPSSRKKALDKAGRMLDPWNNVYLIALDNNYDSQTVHSNAVYSVTNQGVVVVISFGPNGRPDDPAKPGSDDIISGR